MIAIRLAKNTVRIRAHISLSHAGWSTVAVIADTASVILSIAEGVFLTSDTFKVTWSIALLTNRGACAYEACTVDSAIVGIAKAGAVDLLGGVASTAHTVGW